MTTALIAICVALAGPFSTYSAFTLLDRALYWGTMIFAALPISMTLRHLLFRFGHAEGSLRYGLWMVPSMGVIYGSFVWLVSVNYPRIDPALVPPYPTMVMLVGLVALIVVIARRIYADNAAAGLQTEATPGAGATAARTDGAADTGSPSLSGLGNSPANGVETPVSSAPAADTDLSSDPAPDAAPDPAPDPAPDAAPAPRLMRRLPADAQGPILRMEARDHFVHVMTPTGTHAIRLRFADAVAEMDCVPGLCTHRSHWVRLDAVVAAERDGARLFLLLADGARVPVSRGYRDRVQAAGLITPGMLAAASDMERLAAQ